MLRKIVLTVLGLLAFFAGAGLLVSRAQFRPMGGLRAQVGSIGWAGTPHGVELNWVASTSTVAGYNLYRSTTSGGPYTKINSAVLTGTAFLDPASNLATSTAYFYVGTAVDSAGNESIYSTQASVVTPATFPSNPQPMTGLGSKVQ